MSAACLLAYQLLGVGRVTRGHAYMAPAIACDALCAFFTCGEEEESATSGLGSTK